MILESPRTLEGAPSLKGPISRHVGGVSGEVGASVRFGAGAVSRCGWSRDWRAFQSPTDPG